MGPDVLTLRNQSDPESKGAHVPPDFSDGGVATAIRKPRTRFEAEAEMDDYVSKQRTIVISHSSGDQIIALLELVSPGNKSSRHGIQSIVDKSVEALYRGYHLLIVDLFPPTKRDPDVLPALMWNAIAEKPYDLPADEPLTLSAFEAAHPKQLYLETTAVGKSLPEMPLFLEPGYYVSVPFEATTPLPSKACLANGRRCSRPSNYPVAFPTSIP